MHYFLVLATFASIAIFFWTGANLENGLFPPLFCMRGDYFVHTYFCFLQQYLCPAETQNPGGKVKVHSCVHNCIYFLHTIFFLCVCLGKKYKYYVVCNYSIKNGKCFMDTFYFCTHVNFFFVANMLYIFL